MAIIKCSECGKEKSDKVKKCPHCGYKEKRKISKKKIILLSIMFLVIVLLVVCGIITYKANNSKKIKKYDELLTSTGAEVYIDGLLSEIYCYKISDIWHDCIWESRYCDFNEEINDYLDDNESSLNKLETRKNNIGNNIKKLKSYPNKEYKATYDKLVELYGIYSKLLDMAVSPSGNYTNYIKEYNEYSSDFKSKYDELKVLQPEIEKQVEKEK